MTTELKLWNLIPLFARQALKCRNRSAFEFEDREGIFCLVGRTRKDVGLSLYWTRQQELRAELYLLCGSRNGVNSKLLAEARLREDGVETVLLTWASEFKLN